jgi:hypothetical protein
MGSLNDHIREYRLQLKEGRIQTAYKGIMTFMSGLKSHLEKDYPDYSTSGLYFGYMDMTYFAFTPDFLKEKRLKIALVYLHEQGKFEAWLGGTNRKIQAEYINRLSQINLGEYQLSRVHPGVDSIIESVIVEQPNFDQPQALRDQIEEKTIIFINDMRSILDQ